MSLRKILLRLEATYTDLNALVDHAPKSRSKADQQTLIILRHQVEQSIHELEDTQTLLRSGEYPPTQRINKALGFPTADLNPAQDKPGSRTEPNDEPQGMDDIDTIGRHHV